jgi:hypothetical protein
MILDQFGRPVRNKWDDWGSIALERAAIAITNICKEKTFPGQSLILDQHGKPITSKKGEMIKFRRYTPFKIDQDTFRREYMGDWNVDE